MTEDLNHNYNQILQITELLINNGYPSQEIRLDLASQMEDLKDTVQLILHRGEIRSEYRQILMEALETFKYEYNRTPETLIILRTISRMALNVIVNGVSGSLPPHYTRFEQPSKPPGQTELDMYKVELERINNEPIFKHSIDEVIGLLKLIMGYLGERQQERSQAYLMIKEALSNQLSYLRTFEARIKTLRYILYLLEGLH
jgi:hypothetical protein